MSAIEKVEVTEGEVIETETERGIARGVMEEDEMKGMNEGNDMVVKGITVIETERGRGSVVIDTSEDQMEVEGGTRRIGTEILDVVGGRMNLELNPWDTEIDDRDMTKSRMLSL